MMVDLARNYDNGFIALKDISKRQNISKKYLEQIIPNLNKNHLLLSNKGHTGGYKLAKAPEEITVREILASAEGSLEPVSCLDNKPNLCENCSDCLTLPIYIGLSNVINEYLDGITLADILKNEVQKK